MKKQVFALLLLLQVSMTLQAAELVVGVKGMVCAFCAQGVEKKFKEQSEVSDVKVSLEKKTVTLKFKEGKSLTNDKIKDILEDSGYEAVFSQPDTKK